MKTIKLTKGKETIVDDKDYAELSKFHWHSHDSGSQFYAARHHRVNGIMTIVYIHHLVAGDLPSKGYVRDHINGNSLDNRRSNLRIIPYRENLWNTKNRREGKTASKYPGICKDNKSKGWNARVTHNGTKIYLGWFKSEKEASEVYKKFCLRMRRKS